MWLIVLAAGDGCGLYRRDVFIGQGLVSLEGLESRCETRVCVDLLDDKGRKPTGGKVEVVARLREPLTGESARGANLLVMYVCSSNCCRYCELSCLRACMHHSVLIDSLPTIRNSFKKLKPCIDV